MKIKSLNIVSYGKFNNKTIEFGDGLNIVCGRNEAGKSTIMAFIKSMLYGFTSPRTSDISQNDRKKYTPWNGDKLRGEMDIITDDSKQIRISRTSGKSLSFDTLECFDISNSENYSFISENEVGISEDAFLKTFYIKQLGAKVSGENEELAQKLINLTHNASEDVSFGEALDKIRAEMKKYKPLKGNGGLINLLKERISDLNSELSTAQARLSKTFENDEKGKQLAADIENCRKELDNLQNMKEAVLIREKYDELTKAEEDLSISAEALKSSEKDKAIAENYLNENSQYEIKASDVIYNAKEDTAALENTLKKARAGNGLIPFICALIVEILISAASFFFSKNYIWSLGIFLSLLAITTAVYFCFESGRKRLIAETEAELEKKRLHNDEVQNELVKFGVSSVKEYNERLEKYTEAKTKLASLIEKADEINLKIEALSTVIKGIEIPGDYVPRQLPYSLKQIEEMEKRERALLEAAVADKSRIEGIMSSETGDIRTPDIIMTELTAAEAELEEAVSEYEALSLAAKCLEEAYVQMSSDYTPVINKRAGEILSRITGGKYDELYLDKKYSVKLMHGGTRNLGYFSSGTCDVVYFCVRLAVADTLFGTNNPIFIDDGFVQFDEEREEKALNELSRRAREGQQIIMFTCRNPQKLPLETKAQIINL